VFFEDDGGMIEIGEGCFFNNGCMVVSKEHIRIGKNTSFGPNVLVYDHDHNIYSSEDIHDSGYVTDSVIIGDNVWIGGSSVILRGSVIGDGCVIGAGSVIKGTYPPDTVITQRRIDEIRERSRHERKDVHQID
ncbi:MAG: acyltransferase, partial [Hominilimicola sp.]